MLTALLLVGTAVLSGCASVPQKDPTDYTAAVPDSRQPQRVNNGAIYQDTTVRPLFEDVKARNVGDVLTVVLTESTNASKSATTTTSKETDVGISSPTVFGRGVTHDGVPILNTDIGAQQGFDGSGESEQSNSLSGTLTVTVADVLPNGNLVVRGRKRVWLNQGEEFVRIAGIVRPEDIASNNTVPSTRVADARITYSGRGAVSDSNAMGWLTRFFNSPFFPL